MVSKTLSDWHERIRPVVKEHRRPLMGALFSCGFLIFMFEPLGKLINAQVPVPLKIAEIATLVIYVLSYPLGFVVSIVKSTRIKIMFSIAVIVLGIFVVGTGSGTGNSGADSVWILIYAIAMSAMLLPRPVNVITSIGLSVAAFGYSATQQGGPNWTAGGVMLLMAIGMSMFVKVGKDLHQANEEVARLAVAEERSRVARDIHDVLGHSLTTVTVKLGLIRRLLETAPDQVDRVLAEVSDAEQLSRQALFEVRAALSNYRSTSLTAEVAGARAVLASMHIDADLPHAVDNVDPAYQETFAFVLREAVTNVLRHSSATRCEVRLGENWLEIMDNGQAQAGAAARSRAEGGGTGLSGLADRMSLLGGQLEAGPMPNGGFRLWVGVPQTQVVTA